MTDQFDPPDKTIGIDLHHFLGALVLIRPIEVRYQQKTRYGLADATVVDIHVLDGPGAGHCVRNTLIWQKVLQSALSSAVGTGRFKLGRIAQGDAKPGEDPPWILSEANEQDAALARQYVASATYQRNAGINVSGPDRPAPAQPQASTPPWAAQQAPQPAAAPAPPWGQQPAAPQYGAPPVPQQPAAAPPWSGTVPAPHPLPQQPAPPPWGAAPVPAPAGDPWGPAPGASPNDDPPPF